MFCFFCILYVRAKCDENKNKKNEKRLSFFYACDICEAQICHEWTFIVLHLKTKTRNWIIHRYIDLTLNDACMKMSKMHVQTVMFLKRFLQHWQKLTLNSHILFYGTIECFWQDRFGITFLCSIPVLLLATLSLWAKVPL